MDTDYWHSLDRKNLEQTGLSTDYISVSAHPFHEPLDELKAKIFAGTKNVELSFIATRSGSRAQGQPVPEHFTKAEREELKQLAKVNEIEVTVHSPANASALSGFSERGFSEDVKRANLEELKKSIEFAADVAGGGPVTVHAWEFARAPFEAGGKGREEGAEKFRSYKGEEKKAPLYFVDNRTGEIKGINRSQEVPVPVGGFDNPKRDLITRKIEWEHKTIADFEKEAKDKKEDPAKYIYEKFYKKDLEFKEAQAEETYMQAKKIEREHEFQKKLLADLKEQQKRDPEVAKYNIKAWVETFERETRERLTPRAGTKEYKDFEENPITYLEEIEQRMGSSVKTAFQTADSRKLEVIERKKEINAIRPIEEYALGRTAATISEAALYGLKQEREKKLEKPIIISAENVFPEYYGAHPRELRNIIVESRRTFADELLSKGFARDEADAKKMAEDRIKATFDIGHANIWRKYYQGTEEEFKKWLLGNVHELQKEGIIGHVHINDNFGYEDVHVNPGQGNTPIKEFVDEITKEGYTGKMVIEAGGQKQGHQHEVMTEAWKVFNSPIYRTGYKPPWTWTDIEGSYFGRTGSPNYLVGDFAPSRDWTLWSETQLE
jgi:sugar phosphate isomerase/epimerase